MPPEFGVCIVHNAHWWLKDYGNDKGRSRFAWTIDPDGAHRFTHHEAAIALARIIKHAYPSATVRLLPFPYEVHFDSSST